MSESQVRTITEPEVLAVLANPVRTRLLDVLRVDGPATASQLAEHVGVAVGSVSHHMKVLAGAGFVREVPELAKDRRERWWGLVAEGWQWSRAEMAEGPANEAITVAAESLNLSRQTTLARDWLDHAGDDPGWEHAAFASQGWLRLSQDELRELSDEVTGLLRRWRRREIPDDGAERKSVFMFARGFPARP
ncbi:MAG TPA: helix-turn-helix domain-containing protein [Jatrophihabitans sp.]|jgi:DNA-binding transcriptional ArsR family regulator|nr:helix-turn-helix domain-containing protein [Jatrophihabitans sp.]